MDDQLKQSIGIAINMLLVAAILSVVIIFTDSSREMYRTAVNEKEYQKTIEAYNELYMYDNKIVSGADIPMAMIKYARMYNFEIVSDTDIYALNDGVYTINSSVQPDSGDIIWTEEYIVNNILKNDIYEKYKSKFIIDNTGMVSGLQFIKE